MWGVWKGRGGREGGREEGVRKGGGEVIHIEDTHMFSNHASFPPFVPPLPKGKFQRAVQVDRGV